MTRIEEAQDKLTKALTRLEHAAREAASAGPAQSPELEAELAAMRARYARLEGEARAVSDRLDAAIERVRTLLAS